MYEAKRIRGSFIPQLTWKALFYVAFYMFWTQSTRWNVFVGSESSNSTIVSYAAAFGITEYKFLLGLVAARDQFELNPLLLSMSPGLFQVVMLDL